MKTKNEFTRRQVIYSTPLALAAGLSVVASLFGWGNSSQSKQATENVTGSQQPTEEDIRVNERLEQSRVEHEELISSIKQTVGVGETVELANMDVDVTKTNQLTGEEIQTKMADFVWWDGTLETTIDEVNVYRSVKDAAESEALGTIINASCPSDPEAYFLVVRMTLTNIDAKSWQDDGLFNTDAFNPMYMLKGSIDETHLMSTIGSFDGAVEEAKTNVRLSDCFSLAIGETRSLTTGWWILSDCDMTTLKIRPSLSATDAGPITFDLGLSDSDVPAA